MKIINGGVTLAKGFEATGIYAGIKKKRNDMALVYTKTSAKVAGVFTTNMVKASPVRWCMNLVKTSETAHAVVLNSGIANACTGSVGDENNEKMAKAMADELSINIEQVLTCSTGVIGKQLPMEPVLNGVKLLKAQLDNTLESGTIAAEAIMTTDTYSKQSAVEFQLGDNTVVIGGMAKGSGMIHPNMGTMLSVITTDVSISKGLLQEALSEDVKDTFNMVSVDGDTSTNDTLIILANGLAKNKEIIEKDESYYEFCKALRIVTTDLSKQMAADGEGATKLFEVKVFNAEDKDQAVLLSKSIVTSSLVKTAVYGNDANWGRILCAMGYSGVTFDPETVDLDIESIDGRLNIVKNGMATDYSEEIATTILSAKTVTAIVDMKMGSAAATAWGCDLTYDYIKINADYRS